MSEKNVYGGDNFRQVYPLTSASPLAESIRKSLKNVPPGHGNVDLEVYFEDKTKGARVITAHRFENKDGKGPEWAIGFVAGWDEIKKHNAAIVVGGSW